MRVSSDIDPRPLREIYLRAFQHVVEHAQPWTVMCSYNRLNGVYASHNRWLLTEVLRRAVGFEGLVEGGEYVVEAGASSRDLRTRASVAIEGDSVELPLTMASTIEEVLAHPTAGPLLRKAIDGKFDPQFLKLIGPNPVGRLDGLPLPIAEMEKLISDVGK